MGTNWPETGPQGVPGTSPTPLEFSVPAVSSYTVSHGLGRKPFAVIFYDLTGAECEVGVRLVDANSLDILQDNPTAGTVNIA